MRIVQSSHCNTRALILHQSKVNSDLEPMKVDDSHTDKAGRKGGHLLSAKMLESMSSNNPYNISIDFHNRTQTQESSHKFTSQQARRSINS